MQDYTVEVKSMVDLIDSESIIEEIVNETNAFYIVGTSIEVIDTYMFPVAMFQFYNVDDDEKLRNQMDDAIHNAPNNYSKNYKAIAKNASKQNKVFYHIYRVVNTPDSELLHYQFQSSDCKSECRMLLTSQFFGIILPKPTSKQYNISKSFQFQSKYLSNFFYEPLFKYASYKSNILRETNLNYLNEIISELSWPLPQKQPENTKLATSLPINDMPNLKNIGNAILSTSPGPYQSFEKKSPSSSVTSPSKVQSTVSPAPPKSVITNPRTLKKPDTSQTANSPLSELPKLDKKQANPKNSESLSLSYKPLQNIVEPQKKANPIVKDIRDIPSI